MTTKETAPNDKWVEAWQAHAATWAEADAVDVPMHPQAVAGRTRRLKSTYMAMLAADRRMTNVVYPGGF